MSYQDFTQLSHLLNQAKDYNELITEYGHKEDAKRLHEKVESAIKAVIEEAKAISDNDVNPDEPNDFAAIRALSDGGNIAAESIPDLRNRMTGALLGRFIGCTLGAPVEMWSIEEMDELADSCSMSFPPKEYWTNVPYWWRLRYEVDAMEKYTEDGMDGVPVDDDITYTILGLMIVERYGFDFTTEDVGEIWKEILPYACTAEDVALKNLKAGIPANKAAEVNNPYCQWIGANIRADGFAYAAAGDPALAASMGYRDAYLTHRRNGIYGEMFFAAAIAAAFTVNDPIDAIRIAIKEIPRTSALYKDIEWALEVGPSLTDYKSARAAVDERFAGMSPVHNNNNACLTVFALMIGKGDFTKTVGNVVAMGLDNDCTGATVGSIIGAIVGEKGIPSHWTKNFNDRVRTYLKGAEDLSIWRTTNRFTVLAEKRLGIVPKERELVSSLFTEEQFWGLIEKSDKCKNLEDELSELSKEEVLGYKYWWDYFYMKSYKAELWAACYTVSGGCDDEGFDYFRFWLITKGRYVYERAVQDADSLCDVFEILSGSEKIIWKDVGYIPNQVYKDMWDEDLNTAEYDMRESIDFIDIPRLKIESLWDDDNEDLRDMCPRIFDRWWKDKKFHKYYDY